MPSRRGGAIGPDDLPSIIDPQSRSRCSPRHVDRAEGAVGVEEPAILPAGDVLPNDLAAVVNSKNLRQRRAGEINRRQRSFVEQKAVTLDSARTASISADDLARIVDAEGHRQRLARNDDWGKSKTAFERGDR